jgi:hypothetical protein
MISSTTSDDAVLLIPSYDTRAPLPDDAGNNEPWAGETFSFCPESSTQPAESPESDTGVIDETRQDLVEWFRFVRRARDRWLQENPY